MAAEWQLLVGAVAVTMVFYGGGGCVLRRMMMMVLWFVGCGYLLGDCLGDEGEAAGLIVWGCYGEDHGV